MSDIEVENTVRLLADKSPLMTSWKCRLGWHRWTVWGNAIQNKHDHKFRQTRHCDSCRKTEVRRVMVPT